MDFNWQNNDYISSWQNLPTLLKRSAPTFSELHYNNFEIDEKTFFEIYNKKAPSAVWLGKRIILIPWHAILCPIYRLLFTLYGSCKGLHSNESHFHLKQWYHVRRDFNLAKGYIHSLWNIEKASLTIYKARWEKTFYEKSTTKKVVFHDEMSEKILKNIDSRLQALGAKIERKDVEGYKGLIDFIIAKNQQEKIVPLAEKYPYIAILLLESLSESPKSINEEQNKSRVEIIRKFNTPEVFLQSYIDQVQEMKQEAINILIPSNIQPSQMTVGDNEESNNYPQMMMSLQNFCGTVFIESKGEKSFMDRVKTIENEYDYLFPEKIDENQKIQLDECWQNFSHRYQALLSALKKVILEKPFGFNIFLNENLRKKIPHSLFTGTLKMIVSCMDEQLKLQGESAKNRDSDLSEYKEIIDLYVKKGWDLFLIPLAQDYPGIFLLIKTAWSGKSPQWPDVIEKRQKVTAQALANPKNFDILFDDIRFIRNHFRSHGLLYEYTQETKNLRLLVDGGAKEKEQFFVDLCESIFQFSFRGELEKTLSERLQVLQQDQNSKFKKVVDVLVEQMKVNNYQVKVMNNHWNRFVEKCEELKFFLKIASEGSVAGFDICLTNQDKKIALILLMIQKRFKFPKPIAKMIIKRLAD